MLCVMCADFFPCGRLRQSDGRTRHSRALSTEDTSIQTHSIIHANVTERNITAVNSTNSTELSRATIRPKMGGNHWDFSPTLPTVTEVNNTDQRIVGGSEAKPGEIPWQVKVCGGGGVGVLRDDRCHPLSLH